MCCPGCPPTTTILSATLPGVCPTQGRTSLGPNAPPLPPTITPATCHLPHPRPSGGRPSASAGLCLNLTVLCVLCRFGAAAVLGNAEPLGMSRITVKKFGVKGGERFAASYPAHLSPREHTRSTNITDEYQLLLFHYVTRAQHNFVERKINLRSGVYATTYAEIAGNATADTDTNELYRRFEHEYGFDGKHAICQQGGRLASAMVSARAAREWHPIPETPGLIALEADADEDDAEDDAEDEEEDAGPGGDDGRPEGRPRQGAAARGKVPGGARRLAEAWEHV